MDNTSIEMIRAGIEGDQWLVKTLITALSTGFISYIWKRIDVATERRKHLIKNYRGTYQSSSFVFYLQFMFLILVSYLVLAGYIFSVLAGVMGEYEEFSFLVYALTAIGLTGGIIKIIADIPLKFANGKRYQGGIGLIVGTMLCIGGMCSRLGYSLLENEKMQLVVIVVFMISLVGLLFSLMIALMVLDTKKQYRYQWAKLRLKKKIIDEKVFVDSIISKGEWLQYKCEEEGRVIEKIIKKDSFDGMSYYNLKEKRKLVQINTVCNNSTGHIMHDIQKQASAAGWDTLSLVGRRKVYKDLPCEKYGSVLSFGTHIIITTLFDRQGHGSLLQTKRLVARLKEEDPDVIHLHNLHGYYLHIPTLFKYLKKEYKGKVFWTFHDLWPITGHCAYYTMAKCDKWKAECNKCQNKKVYPISWGLDQSKRNYLEKRKLFSGLERLEIITPSQWVAEQVKESFLKEVPIHVVPNGIDLEAFQDTEDDSIYEKYPIPRDKKIILGVASIWEKRKGLEDFLNIAAVLPEEYSIVLVGLSKKQMHNLPSNVIGISKTETKEELVVLYSMADVFLNPSREETFSLVTIEAMACGTPVIALDTSAVKELINSENGIVVSNTDVQDYVNAIKQLEIKKLDRKDIRATVLQYSENSMAEKILELYED